MAGGIIEPSLNPDKDPADANWERQTTDVVNELQHSVNNLVIEPEEKTAIIYADTDNIATNIQNYTPIFAEGEDTGLFVAFKNYTGALPELPVREGITFSPYNSNPVDRTIYQYRRSATRPNNAGNVTYNTHTGAWTSTGGAQPWQKEVPAQDNIPTWVCFAIIEKSDGVGNITKTWSNPVLLYARERASGIVWHTVRLPASNPPSTPSASDCNFTNGILSGLTTNWQQTPPTTEMGGSNKTINDLYWQSNYIAELHPGSATATVTFSTPTSYIPIGTNLQSDNYNGNIGVTPGTAGWAIKRDTGFAEFGASVIRDTLTIGQGGTGQTTSSGALTALGGIATGGAAADVNAGTTTINGGKILTGSISANKISTTNLSAISADLGTITAGTINGGTINAGNITVSGGFTAPQLAVGVILQIAQGSYSGTGQGGGNGTVTTLTATNNPNFNTKLLMIANCQGESGAREDDGSNSTFSTSIQVSGSGITTTGASCGSNSSQQSRSSSKTLVTGNLTKGATYTLTSAVSGNHTFSASGDAIIMEIKI